MATPGRQDSVLELLIHEEGARELDREVAARRAAEAGAKPGVTAYQLWQYAHREPGSPVDFGIERAVRTTPATATRYRRILSAEAKGYSEMAMAASTGRYPVRKVGSYEVRVIEDHDAVYVVVSRSEERLPSPSMMEVEGDAETVRLALPEAVRGHQQMIARPGDKTMESLLALLGETGSRVYLL